MALDLSRFLRSLPKARTALLFAAVLAATAVSGGCAVVRVAGDDATLDSADRQRVIDGVIRNLKEHYVDKDVAQKMGGCAIGA
jgi:hypothetical protein